LWEIVGLKEIYEGSASPGTILNVALSAKSEVPSFSPGLNHNLNALSNTRDNLPIG